MKESKKTKTIAFRVSEEEYRLIENLASAAGKNPNDLCRDLVLKEAGSNDIFSLNERIIFEELAKVRYLIGIGLGLLSTGELNKSSWDETKNQVDNFGAKIAEQLLARRKTDES